MKNNAGILQKLERKFGRFAVPGLMKYIVILYATGFVVYMINPTFYYEWLMLDINMLLKGQVWRLITFIIQPMEDNILFMLLMMYVYYLIGNMLERAWGTFRFNMFYLTGVLFNILVVVLIYIGTYIYFGYGISYPISLYYLNLSMFLAFSTMFPELQFYIMFMIPVKAKFLSILYIVLLAADIFDAFRASSLIGICTLMAVLVAMANFIIYYMSTKRSRFSPSQIKRKMNYKQQVRETAPQRGVSRHRCAVCGRTELDDDSLEFRFCSKCEGNYEYCQDHLFTHTHVKKEE